MNLYIRLENGQPSGHPILLENLLAAYPEIDPDNIPGIFVRFQRVDCPEILPYQINEGVTYEWVDSIVKDVWHIRDMSATEKTNFQNQLKLQWAENGGYPSWILNEELCVFEAPSPRPEKHGNVSYVWDEPSIAWIETINPAE